MKHVYLDNAATTPMHPDVVQAMTEQMNADFGNASSTHYFGRQAHAALDAARKTVADALYTKPDNIVFTGGATESNNTAIVRTAYARRGQGMHIITSAIEHLSVLKPLRRLEREGFRVTYLPVDANGEISLDDFDAALDDDTTLVTLMWGNNEVGSRMPIAQVGARLRGHQAWFHVDATQAFGLEDINPDELGINMLSASAHKLNGPKGVGLLFRDASVHIQPFVLGGEQETKRRAGTENVPGIVGFGAAVQRLDTHTKAKLEDRYVGFTQQLTQALTDANVEYHVNGALDHARLPHVLNLWFPGVSTYALQTNLDLAGFAVSGGSACTAGSLEPSHVLTAMFGAASPRIAESIRISYGAMTTSADIDGFAQALIHAVTRLRTRATAK